MMGRCRDGVIVSCARSRRVDRQSRPPCVQPELAPAATHKSDRITVWATAAMNATFICRQCERTARVAFEPESSEIQCPHCQHDYPIAANSLSEERLETCPVCSCAELYVRKDFSQPLGIAIVAIGFVASSIAWGMYRIYLTYAILFATALIDVLLYVTVRNLLQCYRCSSIYRGLIGLDKHEPFSLETHERFRQQQARTTT
jgi:hypothetical protein